MMPCPVCGETDASPVQLDLLLPLVRCRRCRLVHGGVSAQTWKAAEHYEDYYNPSNTTFDTLTESRYRDILSYMERIHHRGRLLDVGCGAGHLLVTADAHGWSAVGQEVSASGLQWLRSLKTKSGAAFELIADDLGDANLPPASFAAITLIEVIEHLPAPVSILERCRALLEPGGVLFLTTPNFDCLSRRLLGIQWRQFNPDHLCLFDVVSLRTALERAGFRPVRLLTKNIDVPEIMTKLRSRKPGVPLERDFNLLPATCDLRQRIESRQWLRAVKSAINAALRVSRTGDTLEAFAVKR